MVLQSKSLLHRKAKSSQIYDLFLSPYSLLFLPPYHSFHCHTHKQIYSKYQNSPTKISRFSQKDIKILTQRYQGSQIYDLFLSPYSLSSHYTTLFTGTHTNRFAPTTILRFSHKDIKILSQRYQNSPTTRLRFSQTMGLCEIFPLRQNFHIPQNLKFAFA